MQRDFPGRSLIGVKPLQPERDNQLRVLLTCDCGMSTDLTVEVDGELRGEAQAAVTCDGCHTVRWFRIIGQGAGGA